VLPLIVIVGPTAVGKTKLGLDIAKRVTGEIISGDSMQVYRYMDIGTAKIKPEEMNNIQHHLIDIRNPDEPFNVADYQVLAESKIREICSRGHIPIIVGGTGLYIQAVIDSYDFTVQEDVGANREKINELAAEHGNEYLHELLAGVDPPSAQKFHPNDGKRVKRALEYYYVNKKRISDNNSGYDRSQNVKYNMVLIGLTMDRTRLYERINQRVDKMMEEGFLEEVEGLLIMGYPPKLPAMQGLGYKQLAGFLNGQYELSMAIEELKRDTRRYAKRQLTWFRRDPRIHWFDIEKNGLYDKLLIEILSIVGRTININVE